MTFDDLRCHLILLGFKRMGIIRDDNVGGRWDWPSNGNWKVRLIEPALYSNLGWMIAVREVGYCRKETPENILAEVEKGMRDIHNIKSQQNRRHYSEPHQIK